ncbi:alginate O-acetyltransferase AlgF [Pigmentiphaga soli]|uniref:Alginate O-acetyltransferase AlgF n=1 Tax=Pigmentiphaga soli TaxID=1007095 RepID=A0ABP8GTC9_9BURK
MNAFIQFAGLLAALALPAAAPGADIPLYPSGPAQDSAFVRFVNAGSGPLQVQAAGGAALTLPADAPASRFLPVAAGRPISGTLALGGRHTPVSVTVRPGEFATVLALPAAGANATAVIKESPDDFNAMRASLALYNADPGCAPAGLRSAGRSVEIFAGVAAGQARRRPINPVALTVEITCGGKAQGTQLELGALAAGQRYSVFAVPGPGGTRALFAVDALAR